MKMLELFDLHQIGKMTGIQAQIMLLLAQLLTLLTLGRQLVNEEVIDRRYKRASQHLGGGALYIADGEEICTDTGQILVNTTQGKQIRRVLDSLVDHGVIVLETGLSQMCCVLTDFQRARNAGKRPNGYDPTEWGNFAANLVDTTARMMLLREEKMPLNWIWWDVDVIALDASDVNKNFARWLIRRAANGGEFGALAPWEQATYLYEFLDGHLSITRFPPHIMTLEAADEALTQKGTVQA